VTIGQVADLGHLTTVTLTAVNASVTLSTGADFGADSNGAEGESLSTITLNASGGATIDFADGQSIFADSVTDSTTDLALTVSATTAASSTVNVGLIDNTYGTIEISATNAGTLTFDGLTAGSVTATVSGAGNANLGAFITSATNGTGAATINASDMSGSLTVDLSGVTGTANVTTGLGGATSITTSQGASLTTNITLGANNEATDQIVMNGTAAGTINLTNFKAGASNGDAIDIDTGGVEGRNLASGTDDLISIGNAATSLATNAISLATATDTLDLGTVSSDQILVLSGDFATTSLVETAIEASGSRELTFNGAVTASTDVMLIVWDDGSNSYLGVVSFANDIADDATIDAGDSTVTTLVTFTGIADATTLTAANLGTALV